MPVCDELRPYHDSLGNVVAIVKCSTQAKLDKAVAVVEAARVFDFRDRASDEKEDWDRAHRALRAAIAAYDKEASSDTK